MYAALSILASVIGAIILFYFKGKKDEKLRGLERAFEKAKEAQRLEGEINALPDSDIDNRLSKYIRK